MAVPDTHTKPRSVRIDDDLWRDAKAAAAAEGKTVTDCVIEDLERRVKKWKRAAEPTTP